MEARTQRRLIFLSILLVIFLSCFALQDIIRAKLSPSTQLVSDNDIDHITELHIIDGGNRSDLYNKKGVWYGIEKKAEYRVDESRVKELLNALRKITKTDIYSTNKKNHGRFGIGKKKIMITTEGHTVSIYVGNTYNATHQYIRLNEDVEIYGASTFDFAFSPLDYHPKKSSTP